MKSTAMTLIATFAGIAAQAAEEAPTAASRDVAVCMKAGSAYGIRPAEALASKMFARAGVTIRWHAGSSGCPPQAIVISLSSNTPETLMPGAVAYALPFEGVHILMFYDRIVRDHPKSLVQPLLAHAMVHEMTHILQGYSRHSASGVMKAGNSAWILVPAKLSVTWSRFHTPVVPSLCRRPSLMAGYWRTASTTQPAVPSASAICQPEKKSHW